MKASKYIKVKTVYVMLKTTSEQYSELRMRKNHINLLSNPLRDSQTQAVRKHK